jgi:hypothetical protein
MPGRLIMSRGLIKANGKLTRFQRRIGDLRGRIARVTDFEEAVKLVSLADTIEEAMCNAGYRRNTEAIRPANETRFEARWKLGLLLAKIERSKGGRPLENSSRTETGIRAHLRQIGLDKSRANECERISAIPDG